MPSAAKVSWAQLRVGIMAMAAMVIVAVLIFLLTGSGEFLAPMATLRTYMDDSAAMAPKSQVRLNGILVGEIDRIEVLETSSQAEFLVCKFRHMPALAVGTPDACFADHFPPAAILTDEALQIVIIFIMAPGLALVPEQPLQWYGAIWAFSQVSKFVRVMEGFRIIPDGHFSNLPNANGRSLYPCPARAKAAPG